jgi:hypothetical protein
MATRLAELRILRPRREQVEFGKAATLGLVADPILALLGALEHSSFRFFRAHALFTINSGKATRAESIVFNGFNSAEKLRAISRFQIAG